MQTQGVSGRTGEIYMSIVSDKRKVVIESVEKDLRTQQQIVAKISKEYNEANTKLTLLEQALNDLKEADKKAQIRSMPIADKIHKGNMPTPKPLPTKRKMLSVNGYKKKVPDDIVNTVFECVKGNRLVKVSNIIDAVVIELGYKKPTASAYMTLALRYLKDKHKERFVREKNSIKILLVKSEAIEQYKKEIGESK